MLIKGKEELLDRIMEELSRGGISHASDECCTNAILTALADFHVIQETTIDYCQSCCKDFYAQDLAYYAVSDNSIVCHKCAQIHYQKKLRIVSK